MGGRMSAARTRQVSTTAMRWAWEFVKDYNATHATHRLYPKLTPKSAKQTGYRIFHREETQQAIRAVEAELLEQSKVRLHRELEELAVVAHSSVDHYITDDDGRVQLADGAPPNAMRAVSSIKRKVRTIPQKDGEPIIEVDTELRLWSKPEALRMSMQHIGALVDRHELSGPNQGPIPISSDVRDRLASRLARLAAGN